MTHYPYLIVGGGMTAAAAARAIRESDATGTVGLISAEPHPPILLFGLVRAGL